MYIVTDEYMLSEYTPAKESMAKRQIWREREGGGGGRERFKQLDLKYMLFANLFQACFVVVAVLFSG